MNSLTIQFVGTSKTLWPEASHHWDKQVLVDSIIPICKTPMHLKKGAHAFPFEILLSNALSESIECGLGHVRYKVICQVHTRSDWRASSLLLFNTTKLQAKQSVMLVRLPPQDTPRCITQTHNVTPHDQLNMVVESAHLTPGALLPVSLHFSNPDAILSLDSLTVKLIERQKFRAPSKQTTRILHHEITLQQQNQQSGADEHDPSETRFVYWIPDSQSLQVHPTTTNRIIRVRHWIQVALTLTLTNGETKDLWMDTPISVLLSPLDDYHTLPVYQSNPTVTSPCWTAADTTNTPRPSSSSSLVPSTISTLIGRTSTSLHHKKKKKSPSSFSIISSSHSNINNNNSNNNNNNNNNSNNSNNSSDRSDNISNHQKIIPKPSTWITKLYARHKEVFRTPSSSLLLPPPSQPPLPPPSSSSARHTCGLQLQPELLSSPSTPPPTYQEHLIL
ncbi:hypothetical protein BCR42DRAFT_438333 [Absidia repens]|uniref:Arrestin C-terminal-like domain-containing protein n=1 Tax=Absidia repens TaxID=90262 RepID=A0A1X2IEM1_9FUNG|nr:hypothetical protein BCR42DRAFT_438333 [Absidia repens]